MWLRGPRWKGPCPLRIGEVDMKRVEEPFPNPYSLVTLELRDLIRSDTYSKQGTIVCILLEYKLSEGKGLCLCGSLMPGKMPGIYRHPINICSME